MRETHQLGRGARGVAREARHARVVSMKGRRPARLLPLAALLAAFCAGVLVDWALRTYGPPHPVEVPALVGSSASHVGPQPEAATDNSQSADDAAAAPKMRGTRPAPAATTGSLPLRL